MRPKIHLIAPAGSCWPFLHALELTSGEALVSVFQHAIGESFEVTGDLELIEGRETERDGGRRDDAGRAADFQRALADDSVAAILLIRGGAWFTRILPRIDFTVLRRRSGPVALFGFSELTTAVNIVGALPAGRGVYDMGPAFLTYGLKRYAGTRTDALPSSETPASRMRNQLRPELDTFLRDVAAMITGAGTRRTVAARLAAGRPPEDGAPATFVGGNLTVFSTVVGAAFDFAVNPAGKWLLLEDFNEKVERIDRFLAHLTLARYWEECQGILLGDFHKGYENLVEAVLALLRFHLPAEREVPVLVTRDVGHIWPMSPLPLHVPTTLTRTDTGAYSIGWPADALRTVPGPPSGRV
ncbi:MAG: LD-carboxypeptidase [Phycisphaerae bacterium]|jgi:muramoyltetrapeptide carboxypeptidase